MAARSSGGSGMLVGIVILGVFTLGFFVTTIVFLSQKQAADRKLAEQSQDVNELIGQSRGDAVSRLRDPAKKAGKPVLVYLADSMSAVMARVDSAKTTPEELNRKLEKVEGAGNQSLLALLQDRDRQIASLNDAKAAAEQARDRANTDRQNEARRVSDIEASHKETVAKLTAQIDQLKDEVDKYRADINATKARMDQEVDKTRESARAKESELVGQIREAQEKQSIATETVKRLQEQLRGKTFEVGKEYNLVDGRVIGSDAGNNQFYIDIGRRHKVVLGMTFEVYSEATAIRPDPRTGDYPAGKATLEVIKIEDGSATCRLLREKRGNPVVKGDVIANAIYDPNKVYKFLIYGNFDANGDGMSTPQERSDIEALVREWGGVVVAELSGDVDFLVLGEKPVLPPAPSPVSPPPVVQEYLRLRGIVSQYERLFQQAESTSIPIINENRLRTLTGIGYRR